VRNPEAIDHLTDAAILAAKMDNAGVWLARVVKSNEIRVERGYYSSRLLRQLQLNDIGRAPNP
jgi:hypothetical protein